MSSNSPPQNGKEGEPSNAAIFAAKLEGDIFKIVLYFFLLGIFADHICHFYQNVAKRIEPITGKTK